MPQYVVFTDVTLRHIARSYPATLPEMLAIPGIGERKLADYGTLSINAVAGWLDQGTPRQSFPPLDYTPPPAPPTAPARPGHRLFERPSPRKQIPSRQS